MSAKVRDELLNNDPLIEMEQALSALTQKLSLDAEGKKNEFEHLMGETLWRLNAMSERTLEMVTLEEDEVDTFIAQNEKKWRERLEEDRRLTEQRLMNDAFLDTIVENALERLFLFKEEGAS